MSRALTALVGLLSIAAVGAAAEGKRIYIAPDDHTDYMWTGTEEDYRKVFPEMIDFYLDLADRTRSNPSAQQSRWHCDGTLWYWTYEHNRPRADFLRLIEATRTGHISLPLNAVVSTYGGVPTEAVLRGMYYAGDLERRFGIRIPLAIAMEDQTLPYGLGSLWAGAGAKYSWKGICGCLTKLPRTGQRPHEIYWWKGDDGSRLLMKWNTMFQGGSGARTVGGYAEARTPEREINFVDTDPRFRQAYPYSVIGIFGKGWDDLKTTTDEFVSAARSMTTSARQVIVSNINDFFADFEKTYGNKLPEFNASFGNEWDLYSASVSELAGGVRRSVEKLRGAEAMAALVSLHRPEFMTSRRQARAQAFLNLGIFWEHNWTADGTVVSRRQRAAWGRRIAANIETYVDALHEDASNALAKLIANPSSSRRFYVFNPLGWTRDDVADIAYDGPAEVHVVEANGGADVPSQIVLLPDNAGKLHRCLRIEADALPPAGYKVFELRDGSPQENLTAAATLTNPVFENARYRLKLEDRGAIRSLIDKSQKNREFAGNLDNGRLFINDLGLDPGKLELENAGPVSVTVKATGEGPLAHTSRITLYRTLPRVDIRNDINQTFDGTYAWSFSFNLKDPDVRHEELGAIVRARLSTDGGVYSPMMSRLEWLTLNHFADMSGADGAGVTLSNADCAFMKLGDSTIVDGVSRLDVKTPQIQVLAGGQIDAPRAGIPSQGGDSHFLQRFSLRTHTGFNAAAAMKFALEHQNGSIASWLTGSAAAPLRETSYSFLSLSNPDALLWALKPAEDGAPRSLIARIWNFSKDAGQYTLSLQPGIESAKRTSHIETDGAPLPVTSGRVTVPINGSQLQSIRLQPSAAATAGARKQARP